MKCQRFLSSFFYVFIFSSLVIIGCSRPILKMPKSLLPIIKEYRHITLYGNRPSMVNTGIHIKKGDFYSILATGSIDYWPQGGPGYLYHDVRPEQGWPLMVRIGKVPCSDALPNKNGSMEPSYYSGNLYLGIRNGDVDSYGKPLNPEYYQYASGSFSVDIIIWERDGFVQITDFLEKMKEKDPNNEAIIDVLADASYFKAIYLASKETSKEIEETKKEIEELKEVPSEMEARKEEKTAQLEARLAKLTETLAQLEEMKKQLRQEREKTSLLAKKLAEKDMREKDLLSELEYAKKSPPVIIIASPRDGTDVETPMISFLGVVEDDQGLERLEIFINDKPLEEKMGGRAIMVTEKRYPKRFDFSERIPLETGENRIRIRAIDSDGLSSERILTVHKLEIRKNIWAAVIGINDYPHVRQLRYAVDDAKAFYNYLVHSNHIPAENVTLLINQKASLTKLRSTLGTHLKSKAGKEDMVIVYFAGHGATEKDVMSPDGDGLEKYLLPYDADPKDLYASALPMREISHIFHRIRSERLIFIVDSCYSGASGGRTVSLTGVRANISDAFLDRIAGGKGRIILTASGPNEVSSESEKLQHGVFTYFLLEGLRGKADTDKDGVITVDEVYGYVSKRVPQATGQEQHPVKKGSVEGRLILGVIN